MTEHVLVRRGAYHDSVTLMLVSRAAGREDGAEAVAVGMATPLNLELLADQGFTVEDAGPNDLVIAVRARDEAAVEAAVAAVDRELAAKGGQTPLAGAGRPAVRSLRSAAGAASLAFLSIPGEHVAHEGAAALEAGLHVFCFSDGVSVEVEAALKRRAVERGLLFMGPDCGTGILDGVALGFANAVERGPVGIVGASGTGIQEVSCLLDAAGVGISHAIGVGGRDLHAEVGGLMMRRGLELLADDEDTRAIVAISKPPDAAVAAGDRGGRRRRGQAGDPRVPGRHADARSCRGAGAPSSSAARSRRSRRRCGGRPRVAASSASTAAGRCAPRRRRSSAAASSSTSGPTSTRRGGRTR